MHIGIVGAGRFGAPLAQAMMRDGQDGTPGAPSSPAPSVKSLAIAHRHAGAARRTAR